MIFNSSEFLVFLLLFFGLYWWVNNRFSNSVRNLLIIAASYIFYGWWDWRFLGLIVVSSFADFIIGSAIVKRTSPKSRKGLLIASLAVNLGILGFFKYYDFFVDSFVELASLAGLELQTSTLNIVLPVGISFYTFQTLSYTIDIYRGKIQPTQDPLAFFAFVAFFPQLVAGPIERASHLLPQFATRKKFSYPQTVEGIRLMLWGFFKKIVIADNLGVLVDRVFELNADPNGLTVFIGCVLFGFQIYADFSGYSDIAIGLARTFGFNLMTNFRTPFFSRSVGEFWQRWHISLSTWFRDYLYIPLGGNRRSQARVLFNIFITFLVSGLWHGAHITFCIWGGLFGIFLVFEKLLKRPLIHGLGNLYVMLVVTLLWVPFRAVDTGQMMSLSAALLDFSGYNWEQFSAMIQDFSSSRFTVVSLVVVVFLLVEKLMKMRDFNEWIAPKPKWARWSAYYVLILLILFVGNFSVKPSFIYFQF